MLMKYMALININTPLDDMRALVKYRNPASLPVGGRYRLIDFHLSNAVNAEITNVGIIGDMTKHGSLTDHIGNGAPWDLDRKNDGIFFLRKYNSLSSKMSLSDLEANFKYFTHSKQKNIIVMDSSMIFNIDLKKVIEDHEKNNRDVTMLYKKTDDANENFYQCDTLNLDSSGMVTSFGKNVMFNKEQNISLNAFIISKAKLMYLIGRQIEKNEYRTLSELITENIKTLKIKGFEFKGYVAEINSVKNYFDFNMDLLNGEVKDELFESERTVFTKRKDTPSTIYKNGSLVENSLISNGCQIRGTVKNSIIGRRVKIDSGAVVENCVIMQGSHIKAGAVLHSVIMDKDNVINEFEHLNSSPAYPLVIEKNDKITRELWNKLSRGEHING
ncbi:MAG: glucose-1-phosphate adenylyltransferase subunit GlgD [Fusobacteriaceae bacterium]